MSHSLAATVFTLVLWLIAGYDVYVYHRLHATMDREPWQSPMLIQSLETFVNIKLVILAILTSLLISPQFKLYSEGIPFYLLFVTWFMCWLWLKNSAHNRLVIELWEDYFKRHDEDKQA